MPDQQAAASHAGPDAPACAAPLPHPQRPGILPPPGACDCHYHIFGPYDRYPLDGGRSYTPPEASIASFRQLQATLGLDRSVIVQPSVYGTDNRCTMDAVAQIGIDRTRAVVVVDDTVTSAELARMDEAGARGVRINAVSGNGTPVAQMEHLARRIAPLGWHMQIYMSVASMASLADAISALPVPMVIDHMGHLDPRDGTDAPGFQAMVKLLRHESVWAKLCGYRCSTQELPYADITPFAQAMVEAVPDRCVWGTDWPHPTFKATMPNDGALLDALATWIPDAATRSKILVDNPARLYGFVR